MPTYEKVLSSLEHWMSEKQTTQQKLAALRPESFLDEEEFERRRTQLQDEVRGCDESMRAVLEKLDRWPPRHHMRHFDRLEEFLKQGPYEKSVFVMTKYPQAGDPEADRLEAVIDLVVTGIEARGYQARVAKDKVHHRWMWDNIELYLLGCARGVAIVEDRYLPELNPNVAMEWGWMAGMGRAVLFLRERQFKHDRADWKGLIESEFDWTDLGKGIDEALDEFLV
jgi:hypothetical protein